MRHNLWYTGYGDQVSAPVTRNQTYVFDVTEREYTLTVSGVQNESGGISNKTFTAKFGESFDFSSLLGTATRIASKTYTRYFNT